MSKKKMAVVAAIMLLTIGAAGAGVYAALGGAPKQQATGDIELQRGLIGYWPMNGNAKDSTPNANNGTVTAATLTTDRKGATSSAYSFNGTSACITTPSNNTLKRTGDYSISLWVNLTNNTNYQALVSRDAGSDFEIGADFRTGLTSLLLKASGSSTSLVNYFNGYTGVPVYVTISLSGTTLSVYRNAQMFGNVSVAATFDPTVSSTLIGCRTGPTFYTNGMLDDVRIYNRAISSAEVTALYQQYDPVLKAAAGGNGLVGWWKLDGNAKDSSPYANNGTVSGATLVADRKTLVNSAYSFNGTSNTIAIPSSTLFDTSRFTVQAWVYPTANTAGAAVARYSTGVGADGWYIGNGSTANTFTAQARINSTNFSASSGTGYSLNTWHLLTSTYDGTNLLLYVDGVLAASTPASGSIIANTQTLNIGSRSVANNYWPGRIDDVRVYSRALSAAEIMAQYGSYNSQVQVRDLQKGLVGDWPLNGNAKDATPQGNNGTISGAALAANRKARANSAYSFNGTGSDIIDMGNPTALNMNSQVTIAAWVYGTLANTGGNPKGVACKDSGGGITNPPYCIQIQDGVAQMSVNNASNLTGTSGTTICGSMLDNTWYFIVGTYDSTVASSQTRAYLNGQFCNSSSAVSGLLGISTGSFRIGQQKTAFASTRSFNGSIDDVRIWNRTLSANEIAALYTQYR